MRDQMDNIKSAIEQYADTANIEELQKSLAACTESKARNLVNERKSLTWNMRNEIFKKVVADYSMLRKDKGIFHAQLFHAMDTYLKACNDTGYKIVNLPEPHLLSPTADNPSK